MHCILIPEISIISGEGGWLAFTTINIIKYILFCIVFILNLIIHYNAAEIKNIVEKYRKIVVFSIIFFFIMNLLSIFAYPLFFIEFIIIIPLLFMFYGTQHTKTNIKKIMELISAVMLILIHIIVFFFITNVHNDGAIVLVMISAATSAIISTIGLQYLFYIIIYKKYQI
jgi:hypothetical protein